MTNQAGRPNGYTAKEFISAIPGTGGIVSTIAQRIGCTWHTARRYIDTMPTVKTAYDAESERVLDMAEGVLLKSIEGGDTQDSKWYLTRKGKHRGYAERQEVEHSGEVGHAITYLSENRNATDD